MDAESDGAVQIWMAKILSQGPRMTMMAQELKKKSM